ncbi:hypothetical protein ACOQFV_03190 [Nocardiopsis changdeensis]|uniref:Uncharacterized protein n=1 Tax=Nocardiopsis changdeensis TaxID=2831969 RepID=A0ABX8BK61_9ACTN|nr:MULTISPECIES: hypothetical protein [Nocardiopsis]QUX22625.1 hypothetical protein KGD84_30760 [Nocardiopsis changdeensis]QYX38567.1 hypothetical protein K1J57_08140 [Nocardiopsis sp. MT53]
MKFELVEPADWEDPPQAAHDEPEPVPAAGPIRVAAGHARERFRAQADALQATLGRMWEVITSAQARQPVVLPADAVTPANFRPGAFSSRDA